MTEEEPKEDFHTGPEDCQKCGAQSPFPVAKFGKPGKNGKILMACICMDCLIEANGMEWREATPTTIVVPEGIVH